MNRPGGKRGEKEKRSSGEKHFTKKMGGKERRKESGNRTKFTSCSLCKEKRRMRRKGCSRADIVHEIAYWKKG